MKRRFKLGSILCVLGMLFASALPSLAMQAAQGFCQVGGQLVQFQGQGLQSTSYVQASYPQCTVTVTIHGGGIATIFSDNSSTPLANPFTANTDGSWDFYAVNGRYDITLSNAGFVIPFTLSDVLLQDSIVAPFSSPPPIGNITPNTGAFTTLSATSLTAGSGSFTSLSASAFTISSSLSVPALTVVGQITSSLATGTPPLVINSTTLVPNLNAALLQGSAWASPPAIGATSPNTGSFSTLSSSGIASLSTALTPRVNTFRYAKNFPGADIAAQIAAAWADCSNNCGVVIDAGTYNYANTIIYPVAANGTGCLIGSGPQTVLHYTGANDAMSAVASSPISNANVCIRDFTITGTASANFGLRLRAFNRGIISNVTILGFSKVSSAAFLNEGVNAVSFIGDQALTSYFGVENIGYAPLVLSTNAIKWIGGQIAYNTQLNWYENPATAATTGPNIGNSAIGVTFEVNSTLNNATQIFVQQCSACTFNSNYIEADAGSTLTSQMIIGDGSNAIKSIEVKDNVFASSASVTNTIFDADGQGSVITGNTELGAPTNFIAITTSTRNGAYCWNSATAATHYVAGSDAGNSTEVCGLGTGYVNAHSPTLVGQAFNYISSLDQDLVIRERASSSGNVNTWQAVAGAQIASMSNTGNLTLSTGLTAPVLFPVGGFVKIGSSGNGNMAIGAIQNGVGSLITVPNPATSGTFFGITVATGSALSLPTTAITTGACGATTTVTVSNSIAQDVVTWSYTTVPASPTGDLTVFATPDAGGGSIHFVQCNPTAGTITPAASAVNWRVQR